MLDTVLDLLAASTSRAVSLAYLKERTGLTRPQVRALVESSGGRLAYAHGDLERAVVIRPDMPPKKREWCCNFVTAA
jgi:hypothetical protein